MQTATKTVPSLRFPEHVGSWREVHLHDFLIPTLRAVAKPNHKFLAIGIRSHCRGTFQRKGLDPEDISMDTLYVVKEDDLIVNITFAWEGAIAIARAEDNGGLVSHRFPTYVFNEEITGPSFFQHVFVQGRFRYFLRVISPGGAGRNRVLDKKDFLKLAVRLPERPEQEKITAFHSVVDEKIEQLARKKKLLLKYKKGVMQHIFNQKIRFKDDCGNDFLDWEQKTLGELGSTFGGLVGKSFGHFGEGLPYVTYKQIFDNSRIECERFEYVRISPTEKQNRVSFGDVFFTTSSETAGEVAYASVMLDKVENVYLNSFCFGYRAHSLNTLRPQFSRYLFRSDGFRRKVFRLAQGSTRYNISKTEMMKLSIALPSPAEQAKIAEFLSAIDEKIEQLNRELEYTKTFKKGLLQQMFV